MIRWCALLRPKAIDGRRNNVQPSMSFQKGSVMQGRRYVCCAYRHAGRRFGQQDDFRYPWKRIWQNSGGGIHMRRLSLRFTSGLTHNKEVIVTVIANTVDWNEWSLEKTSMDCGRSL